MPPRRLMAAACAAAWLALPAAARAERLGFCNPWFPTPAGARWEYEETSGAGRARAVRSISVHKVEKTATGERAELRQTVREASRRSLAQASGLTESDCVAGRITLTTRGAAKGKAGDAEARGQITARIPGLPPATQLVVGSSWTATSRIETTEGNTRIVIDGQRESRVVSQGPVEVPAGSFAKAIEIRTRQTLSRKGAAAAHQEIREWYVRGVGLVKRATRVAGGMPDTSTLETLRHFSR
ncbi:MAG: hypothetical protein VCC00_10745 [Deltaproteobacteria bacterium]